MTHTYTALLYHVIFSTKGREPCLTQQARSVLFPYMAGIVERFGGKALIINGAADHVHALFHMNSMPDLAEAMKQLKGSSSAWFNREPGLGRLRWQEGYGAFTVSHSQRGKVYKYIKNQEEHHRMKSFAEEYEEFLVKHGIAFDRRFFLD